MQINVNLTDDESIIVETIVTNRYIKNRGDGVDDRLAANRDPIENDIEAFGAELAVCKHFNIYPDLQWTEFRNNDLRINGFRVDVKKIFGRNMNVRKTSRSNEVDYYVGVGGSFPDYQILGALSAERVKSYELKQGRNDTEYWSIPVDHLLDLKHG